MSNQPFFVPTRFVWRFGGRQVHLCGSFTRWVETVPMALVDSSSAGTQGVFAVVVHLPPGYHQYKFIVDGKWRHDETAPFMPDPLGNVNNWLFVRRIDSNPNPGGGFDSQFQQLAQQQQMQQQMQQMSAQQQQQQIPHSQPNLMFAGLSTTTLPSASMMGPVASPLPPPSQLIAAPLSPHLQHSISTQPLTGPLPSSSSSTARIAPQDVDMTHSDSMANLRDPLGGVAGPHPIVIHNPKEPEYTRKKVGDFLTGHNCYELIPESGKVVVIDVDLPVRQAFHALYEQGASSAPLWDGTKGEFVGVISASDFISILTRLRHGVATGGINAMNEIEMDAHTIRGLRDQAGQEGREPKPLAYIKVDDDLSKLVATLAKNKCSMTPVLTCDLTAKSDSPVLLHLATLSVVFSCLMRHFRASLSSLPLLSQPLGSLPLGTWSPDASINQSEVLPDSKDRRQWRKLQPLHTVTPTTLLTTALSMLLETGISALPVVDDNRRLLDIYARSDITSLCKGNSYGRLQFEDVTVGQALALNHLSGSAHSSAASISGGGGGAGPAAAGVVIGGLSAEIYQQQQRLMQQQMMQGAGPGMASASSLYGDGSHASVAGRSGGGGGAGGGGIFSVSGGGGKSTRVHVCSKDDPLKVIVDRLAVPGVRRLVVVHPESLRVEGIVSLSDVASYLFL